MKRLLATTACALAIGCSSERAASSPPDSGPSTTTATTSPPVVSSSASVSAVVSASAAATTASLPARAPGDLIGETIDFPYDGSDVKDSKRAYEGRVFVTDKAAVQGKPVPLVVFFHGLNRDLIPHRWMGGGNEGDVRRIVGELVAAGTVEPLVLAGPGSIEPAAVSGGASFPTFDFDNFIALTERALDGRVKIDKERIVVTGHSGAGCSAEGGIVTATKARIVPLAVVSIDTCMGGALAEALGRASPRTNVLVTWQTASWSRSFDHFKKVFDARVKESPPLSGILRELDQLPNLPKSHDATVKQTFDKWLPKLLPPG
ncbi:MAG: hypothetical protein HOV80_08265 [Polyangiaceae bacterium]|nr:hypothetical protein [Polyangiaceae bacterium]